MVQQKYLFKKKPILIKKIKHEKYLNFLQILFGEQKARVILFLLEM